MSSQLNELSNSQRWRLLVDAAKRGADRAGYKLDKMPGRGLSNVWELQKGGKTSVASIRTTQDRWIAFPPLEGGKRWKTLDDVELVIIAAVDSKEDPKDIEVFIVEASDVRTRFNAAYAARKEAGNVVRDGYGMWVALDDKAPASVYGVGSGLVDKASLVAKYSVAHLLETGASETWWDSGGISGDEEAAVELNAVEEPLSISEAKRRLAASLGVSEASIKITIDA